MSELRCGFCYLSESACKYLIRADDMRTCICDSCVEICRDILGSERVKKMPPPKEAPTVVLPAKPEKQ